MMKLVILSALVAVTLAASQYRGVERDAAILRLDNQVNPDGSYSWAYDTENGITAQEQGQQRLIGNNNGNAVQGSYRYTSPEGIVVEINYISDENGYQPQGNVLPR